MTLITERPKWDGLSQIQPLVGRPDHALAKTIRSKGCRNMRHSLPSLFSGVVAWTSIWLVLLAGTNQLRAQENTNRLAKETSLYLRSHAHNPVDWFPWGEEALAKAKQENKLIFLSVGYSSCHWCHVMEKESFSDQEIAKFLNDNFVCIKVDREERPDLDAIYMMAVQIRSGRGGWPMSVFLTPDAKPFFGATYFPARDGDRPGQVGFFTVAQKMLAVWKQQPENVQRDADTIADLVNQEMLMRTEGSAPELSSEFANATYAYLKDSFDVEYGGFGFSSSDPNRPKFPEPPNLLFLIDHIRRTEDPNAEKMLVKTLEQMSLGGIWDHFGGGFHRYSTDRFWRIPHFEKMLYDNGQLLSVYAEAYALTGRSDFQRTIEETVGFLLRDMQDPQTGAFYAAIDADSEGEEGKFYRWEQGELKDVLAGRFDAFAATYNVAGQPNFEDHYYVPQLGEPISDERFAAFAADRKKLFEIRNQRIKPVTDPKIITSWNGLAIKGLADSGRLLKRSGDIEQAIRAAEFIHSQLRESDGKLRRTYAEGQAKFNAYLDDYAFYVQGLIGLHQATQDARWLQLAHELTDIQIADFWDETNGGFYFTSNGHEQLIARSKQSIDGVQPSGNSVSAANLLYLAKQTKDDKYRTYARRTVEFVAAAMKKRPGLAAQMDISLAKLVENAEQ
ncbi:MAG: thioredoxin domain-containing protein [Pirellulaceae bacterium]